MKTAMIIAEWVCTLFCEDKKVSKLLVTNWLNLIGDSHFEASLNVLSVLSLEVLVSLDSIN